MAGDALSPSLTLLPILTMRGTWMMAHPLVIRTVAIAKIFSLVVRQQPRNVICARFLSVELVSKAVA